MNNPVTKPSADFHGPNVLADARVHVTDFGPVWRVDLNMLGATLDSVPADHPAAWEHEQNGRLCDAMSAAMAKHGGSFDSIAEWTVAVNRHYDLQDMRNVRTARWRSGGGSAITTLPWAHPASPQSVSIQTVGYVPKDSGAHVRLRAWQPECLYDGSFLGLATASVVEIGDLRLIYLAGVVAWDKAIQPLAGDDPRAQMRLVLQMIHDVFREAGGSPADVVRLRPFTASPAIAQMLREESARLAAEQRCPEPTLLIAEDSSFWAAPSLFTEIQVMGIVGRNGCAVGQEDGHIPGVTSATTRIRRTTTPMGSMIHVADLRAPAGTDPKAEMAVVVGQVARVMSEFGLNAANVCLALVYASSLSIIAELTAALRGQIDRAAWHVVYCPPMPELAGGTLKLELTAWQRR